jgi:inorganic pyrophosphatase
MTDKILFQAHPWHGISPGDQAPAIVTAYIEMAPLDTVKYEIDKSSGHLKLDRPHKYSSLCPSLYGFIPQTYCDDAVAALARKKGIHAVTEGDKDPIDICVFTERPISRGGILVTARPIGGFRLIDKGEADDKIIAVLIDDPVFGACSNLSDMPIKLIDRLKHYFLTYKEIPDHTSSKGIVELSAVYGVEEALEVIQESFKDYKRCFK